MKKTLFTILSMIIIIPIYSQEIKTEKEKFRLVTAGKMKSNRDKSVTLFSEHAIVSVPNKLEIEADSVLIDNNKNLLVAYGTKTFTFKGKVLVGKEHKQVCRFHLGEDTLILE